MKPRILRITTAAISLKLLLEGQFTFFGQQGFDVLTVSANGPEVQQLKNQGIAHRIVPMTRMITPLRDLYCLILLMGIIMRSKPDIVHTHTPKAGLLGMIASWICRVPVRMHTVAGLPMMETTGLKRSILKLTERITYACAHHVYSNSTGLLKFIHDEFGLEANPKPGGSQKFGMIGKGSSNGIDTQYFSRSQELTDQANAIRTRLAITDSDIVFSFVGRIVSHKGIVELTAAYQQVVETIPSRLLLVGSYEGDLDPLPQKTKDFLEKDKRVFHAGFQEDVRPWIMASTVFVLPSYREGFPNVVMQAACLEVPCIVSDINGNNEIIQNEKTGLLVAAKNVESLSKAMILLARESTRRKEFGRRSREFVVSNFDRKFYWAQLLAEYNRLLVIR